MLCCCFGFLVFDYDNGRDLAGRVTNGDATAYAGEEIGQLFPAAKPARFLGVKLKLDQYFFYLHDGVLFRTVQRLADSNGYGASCKTGSRSPRRNSPQAR